MSSSSSRYFFRLFLAAFGGSLLLMASGLFLGHMGIDDELLALSATFDGIDRGLWAQQLITYLLPGQLGISFAPMVLGCALYSLSIAIVIYLWGAIPPKIGYISAVIISTFPYFASMMTFDVAQVAYPAGYVFVSVSLALIFFDRKIATIIFSSLAFAIGFACYQGVSATFATSLISVVGMRYLASISRKDYNFNLLMSLFRASCTMVIGSLFYLLSVKASKAFIAHSSWSDGYQVKVNFVLSDPGRLASLADNAYGLIAGRTGDSPFLPSVLLFVGIVCVCGFLCTRPGLSWYARIFIPLFFASSLLILPFWIMLIQPMPLTPRSSVGLGVLYGYIYATLMSISGRRMGAFLTGISILIITSFVFTGNQMYYSQFLSNRAEHMAVSRIIARVDLVARENQLSPPYNLVINGGHLPARGIFAQYDTLGSSPLAWDNGNPGRQKHLLDLYGIDGVDINTDELLNNEVAEYISSDGIPGWPHPGSVFLFKDSTIVLNFRGPNNSSSRWWGDKAQRKKVRKAY